MIVPMRTPEEKQTLATHLARAIGCTYQQLVCAMPYEIVAVVRDRGGKKSIAGCVMYINYRYGAIEMACAGDPGWLTKEDIRNLFAYPFLQLGCYTIITSIKRSNSSSREFNARLGFSTLGVIESGLGRSEDTVITTLTRPQCKWLTPADHAFAASRTVRPAVPNGGAHGLQSAQPA